MAGERLRYNPDCSTCRRMTPAQIEQTRKGGEWRVKWMGRTLAHAQRKQDAAFIARLMVRGKRAADEP